MMKDLPGDSKDHQLTVALRIRPMNEAEIEEGATLVAHKVDNQMVVLMDPSEDPDDVLRANRSREKTYMFDVAFDFTATQEDVYVATMKNLIEGVISGYNATVFAYGPTGTGKTYTMLGIDSEPGIYIRTLNDLFKAIEEASEDMDCSVYMSYLEIYNEMIRDLLNPASGYLDLREDAKGEIRIAGITEVSTSNAKEIMQLLTKGNKQRTQEPTAANKTSSRSHAILQVTVKQKSRVKNINEEVRVGKLFMVDLAGTERAAQTQNRGMRMKEGAHINRSMLALANCINALSEKGGKGAQFVNYRDSKLTRLLKDALGGNSRTVMITHISPASTNFEESRNTLIYADKAKNIRTKVKRNLLNVSYHIAQYTSIIADLRKEIERLRAKIDEQGHEQQKNRDKADIRDVQAEVQKHSAEYSRREMGRLREQLLCAFREQMEIRRSLMELEKCNMELHIVMSRHLVTITDWEREKARCAKKWREERRSEKMDKDREWDSGAEELDSTEPQDVLAAREEIATLLAEQRKTTVLKSDLEEKLASMKMKSSKMEELLPKRISNEEQREILALLCRVHELEVENTEIRSMVLCKENALRTKDFVIQRYDQHRSLCDEIIQQQKTIIEDYEIPVPHELEQLYTLYFNELRDGSIDQILSLHTITSSTMLDGSILDIAKQMKLGDLIPDKDKDDLTPRTVVQENRKSMSSRNKNKLPSLVPDHESESNKVFKSTTKSHQLKRGHIFSSPTSLNQLIQLKGINRPPEGISPETMKAIASDTKSISVVAARRRSRIHNVESGSSLFRAKERSLVSVQSLEEAEESDRAASEPHGTPGIVTVQPAISMDSLAIRTPEGLEVKRLPLRVPGSSQSSSKKELQRADRGMASIERRARKKRSKSFEANLKRKPKISTSRNPVLESISDNRLARHIQNSNQFSLKKGGNPSPPLPATNKKLNGIKYPISHHKGESHILKLEMRGTPPCTVLQKNAEGRRGQTLHKRVRGPSELSGTNKLLLQPGNFKRTLPGTRHKGASSQSDARHRNGLF
ncbi:kinesin-like protein KIF19 [Scleropages formosus]|uniref:Kinesin-like protein KIF19 n=1 Tax=Scleropages formosus TaxID=113540 RepID=A0A8C9R644_SCLFO|nr:kinesin-like protein KIF19 [Scleropages formosus]